MFDRKELVKVIDDEASTYDPVTNSTDHELHEGLTLADGSDMAERIADRVIRLFEQSLTPTNDEREALARAQWDDPVRRHAEHPVESEGKA